MDVLSTYIRIASSGARFGVLDPPRSREDCFSIRFIAKDLLPLSAGWPAHSSRERIREPGPGVEMARRYARPTHPLPGGSGPEPRTLNLERCSRPKPPTSGGRRQSAECRKAGQSHQDRKSVRVGKEC